LKKKGLSEIVMVNLRSTYSIKEKGRQEKYLSKTHYKEN
jgi:hypothetical protein